jgi:hypothetical protein
MIDDRDETDVPAPLDLSPLDPLRDDRRFAALADSIVRDAMAARRPATRVYARQSVMALLSRWSTPILAAAAVVVAAAVPMLARSTGDMSPIPSSGPAVESAGVPALPDRFGIPGSIILLAQSRGEPTPAELIAAFDPRSR